MANTLHPALRMVFYVEKSAGPDTSAQGALYTQMQGEVARHPDRIEAAAGEGHGWFNGLTPSVLDLYLGPCLHRLMHPLPRGGADWFRLADWPNLQALRARFETRDSMRRAVLAEGLRPRPFPAPDCADPHHGTAV